MVDYVGSDFTLNYCLVKVAKFRIIEPVGEFLEEYSWPFDSEQFLQKSFNIWLFLQSDLQKFSRNIAKSIIFYFNGLSHEN